MKTVWILSLLIVVGCSKPQPKIETYATRPITQSTTETKPWCYSGGYNFPARADGSCEIADGGREIIHEMAQAFADMQWSVNALKEENVKLRATTLTLMNELQQEQERSARLYREVFETRISIAAEGTDVTATVTATTTPAGGAAGAVRCVQGGVLMPGISCTETVTVPN